MFRLKELKNIGLKNLEKKAELNFLNLYPKRNH